MFDLEKHKLFLKDKEENPQKYDGESRGLWSYGLAFDVNTWFDITLHCPNCGSNNGSSRSQGGYSWNECHDCKWMGDRTDLLTYEELLNRKRFKKLNEIL